MKTMKKFLSMAFVAVAMLGFTACGDDDEGGATPNALTGTEWVYSETDTETEEGVTYAMTLNANLKFLTATNGTLDLNVSTTVNGQPAGSYSDNTAFTYTYDNGRGTMTAIDEETGETMSTSFTVNGNKLTMIDVDEETGETMEIVFTRK